MKKSVIVLSALIFSLALVISGLAWADDGRREEGSGLKTKNPAHEKASDSKEYKDNKYSEEYQSGKAGYIEEGSGGLKPLEKKSDHKKMKAVTAPKKMKTTAPMREGS